MKNVIIVALVLVILLYVGANYREYHRQQALPPCDTPVTVVSPWWWKWVYPWAPYRPAVQPVVVPVQPVVPVPVSPHSPHPHPVPVPVPHPHPTPHPIPHPPLPVPHPRPHHEAEEIDG